MPKRPPRPSQTWGTFLATHVRDLVAIDFFTVPTARLRILFVLVVLAHHRRRVVHFNVTEHPTAHWTAQQIVDAFPDESAPAYLLRDRDQVYGRQFRHRVKGMGLEEVLTAPQGPWQNPFAERLIGSIRRECLNHVLVFGERHLRLILTRYFAYYHRARTHIALDKDAPDLRPIELPNVVDPLDHRAHIVPVSGATARSRSSIANSLAPRAVGSRRVPGVPARIWLTPLRRGSRMFPGESDRVLAKDSRTSRSSGR